MRTRPRCRLCRRVRWVDFDRSPMIDWRFVGVNSLWILGCSIVLAAFSYHHWLARETDRALRDVLSQPSWTLPFSAGMILTCTGFACALSVRWWEQTLWMALAVSYAWQFVTAFRQRRRNAA